MHISSVKATHHIINLKNTHIITITQKKIFNKSFTEKMIKVPSQIMMHRIANERPA